MKLPLNCEVEYISNFLSQKEVNELYSILIEKYKIDQSRIIVNAGGKLIKTDSFKILFANESLIEQNSHPEEIHGKSFVWSEAMKKLKGKVQALSKKEFDLAMCLYYPNGNYFAPYHSDQLTSGSNTIIPSISLGQVREFSFKDNISDETYNLDLASGSLLLMGKHCQSKYSHSLLQNPKYKQGRINITFRDSNFQ